MKGTFRQSMTWLHTWAGLILCWVMYFMFITGTLGYFDTEIDHWMKPELNPSPTVPFDQQLSVATARLSAQANGASLWRIFPTSDRQTPQLKIFWEMPATTKEQRPERHSEILNNATGLPLAEKPRATGGGQALYRMHYILHYLPTSTAYRFIGIVTFVMFIGLVTGVIVHKKIFKDFFTFRSHKGRRSWLDMHNLLSVVSLPFQLMITYSGLIFMLTTWMPLVTLGSYGFDRDNAADAIRESRGRFSIDSAQQPAPLAAMGPIAAQIAQHWGDASVRYVEVHQPNDTNARVIAYRQTTVSSADQGLVFDGVSGELLTIKPAHHNAPAAVARVFIGLHEGLFAGPLLRWLYFLSGLLGAGMVATGAIYWVVKRRSKTANINNGRGYRFVEVINTGTITGLPIAIAAYFWANRLLPLGIEHRGQWEMHCLFITWGACFLHALLRKPQQAWSEQCWAGAAVFSLLPIINALTTDRHIINSVINNDWVRLSFDMTALCTAGIFAIAAYRLKTRQQRRLPRPDLSSAVVAS